MRARYAPPAAVGAAGTPPLVLVQRDNATWSRCRTRHNAAGEVWHVVEGRALGRHTGHELPACARQVDDLVRPILCNPVKGVDTLCMIVRCEHARPAVAVK